MNLRRILLRIMLASLAVAAVVGALAVLMMPSDAVWRIVGTGVISAVASAILLLVTKMTDKPRSRSAGLLAAVVVLVEFLLSLVLVWDVPTSLGGDFWDRLAGTTALIPAIAIPTVLLVYWIGGKTTRWAGIVGTALAVVVFLLAMVGIWGQPWDVYWKFGTTSDTVSIFGAMLVLCLIGLQSGDRQWWRWLGVAAALWVMGVTIFSIWHKVEPHEGAYAIMVSVAALFAYANLIQQTPLLPNQKWVLAIAFASALATAACIDTTIIVHSRDADDLSQRFAAASGIVCGCATLALAILAALNRRLQAAPVAITEITEITVVCPLCKKKQSLPPVGSACSGCGLRIVIQLEEPHCASCGYLLIGLKSDRCPECGTMVASQLNLQT